MSDSKAIATKAFDGAPDGSAYPERFEKGDAVLGDLATVAVDQKWARAPKDDAEFDAAMKVRADRLAPAETAEG